jgi:phospholipid-translocating ATPase
MSKDNLLLRGTSLRNTEFVIGMIVYSGHETKEMENMSCAKYKQSRIEK